ncbi:hypothetical protein EW026_g5278 [Hermanssonia centrifuga]|uniref:Uncharacterized protein n=1 Tax=Hermanssonia centrifuga TaxID=98765 RepID=A0A4S4KIZ0_9APHY|nr:hypothetical protein EW026_g5278 [Hermanssonia centrifuga]
MSEQLLQFSFDSTLGAVFIGYIFALVLYGVTCLQTIIYFHKCAKDSLLLKSLIATLWLLDNLHTILISHGTYLLLVSYHANPFEAIAAPPW